MKHVRNESNGPRGFDGISRVASADATASASTSDTGHAPAALISLLDFPSMAAPWASADDGEGWRWGDFVLTFQKQPPIIAAAMQGMTGKKVPDTGLRYLFVASVFYAPDRNPHGPSIRPVLSVGLERSDFGAVAKSMGISLEELGDLGKESSVMIGVFSADGRLNLGHYDGPLTADAARNALFAVVERILAPTGSLTRIGSIAAARNLFPAPPGSAAVQAGSQRPKQGSGCLTVIVAGIGIATLLGVSLYLA